MTHFLCFWGFFVFFWVFLGFFVFLAGLMCILDETSQHLCCTSKLKLGLLFKKLEVSVLSLFYYVRTRVVVMADMVCVVHVVPKCNIRHDILRFVFHDASKPDITVLGLVQELCAVEVDESEDVDYLANLVMNRVIFLDHGSKFVAHFLDGRHPGFFGHFTMLLDLVVDVTRKTW